ncbi:MAG: 5'-nucleotidase C-terminal domain-containing protein [Myxococcaceae bacterium]
MKTPARHLLFAAALAVLSSGCLAYNEQCQGLVKDTEEVVGYIGETVYLDKPNARHANNALGQMAADAFVDAFLETVDARPANFGVMNGGAIRAEGLCVTRNSLGEGLLKNGVLHEILLFENLVKAVDLTEPEVIRMMEHSVDRLVPAANPLKPAGTPITSPAGQFLHVSKEVHLEVNCALTPGSRVTRLIIGGVTLPLPAGNPDKRYRVALSAFLLGGDGYDMLAAPATNPDRNPAQAQIHGGTDGNIAAEYMQDAYPDKEHGLKVDPTRIVLTNCAVPVAPAN